MKVPEEEKSRRLAILQDLQNCITAEELARTVGTEAEVLVEGRSKMQDSDVHCWKGRDEAGRIVNFPAQGDDLTGKMARVRILAAKKHSLLGEIRGDVW